MRIFNRDFENYFGAKNCTLHTIVKIGKEHYKVIFDTEQYVGESEEKPQTVHLYNIHEISKTTVRYESKNSIKHTIGGLNNIIPHINKKVTINNLFEKECNMKAVSRLGETQLFTYLLYYYVF